MPAMHYTVRWPDAQESRCYSPSLVIKDYFEPGESYDYVSGCPLETSSGEMAGTFHMIDDQGATFDIDIPTFALIPPGA